MRGRETDRYGDREKKKSIIDSLFFLIDIKMDKKGDRKGERERARETVNCRER